MEPSTVTLHAVYGDDGPLHTESNTSTTHAQSEPSISAWGSSTSPSTARLWKQTGARTKAALRQEEETATERNPGHNPRNPTTSIAIEGRHPVLANNIISVLWLHRLLFLLSTNISAQLTYLTPEVFYVLFPATGCSELGERMGAILRPKALTEKEAKPEERYIKKPEGEGIGGLSAAGL